MKPPADFLPPHEVLQTLADLLCGMSPNGTNPAAVSLAWRRPLVMLSGAAPADRPQLWPGLLAEMHLTPDESKIVIEHVGALAPGGSKRGRMPGWLRPQSAGQLMREVFPVSRCAVKDTIPEGLNLFVSPPKIGKSTLMLHLSLAIGSGGKALGQIDVDRGSVLYFSLEDGPRRLQKRLEKMTAHSRVPADLYIQYSAPSLDDGLVDGLAVWLAEHPDTRMIVIDTLARVRPRTQQGESLYQQDYEALAPLQELAKEWNVAIVVVHHTRKMVSDDVLEMASGTNGLTGVADAVLVLQRGRGESEAVLHVISKDFDQDMAHAFAFDPVLGTYRLLGDAAAVLRSKERNEVIDLLKKSDEALWPREIADLLGKKQDATRQLLANMKSAGEIVSDHGRYKLPLMTKKPSFGDGANNANGDHDDNGGDDDRF